MVVGRDQRLFAAHEDVLSNSPFFSTALKDQMLDGSAKQLALPDEYAFLSPLIFLLPASIVLTPPFLHSIENPKLCPVSSSSCTRVTTIHACSTASVATLGISRAPRTRKTEVAADPVNQ
jgi:hypothetical protein